MTTRRLEIWSKKFWNVRAIRCCALIPAQRLSLCILLAFILIFIAGYSYTENGVTVEKPEPKNPNYIDGTKRQVYEFLQNFTPGGQIIVIDNMSVDKPVILAVYDGIILLAATGFGMVIFRRKDLK